MLSKFHLVTERLIYVHIVCVLMASINISVRTDAYDFLKNLKSENQSFSDVILSFKKNKDAIMNFFGVLKNLDWDMKEGRISDLRRSFDKRAQ